MTCVLIIGGGLAGAAAAARLGPAALLLEREAAAHDKICGEFLSGEAGSALARLGFDLARLGGAPISHVRLRAGTRSAQAPPGFTATGITRRLLDAALLEHAEQQGAQVQRGVTVRSLTASTAQTTSGDVQAGTIFLATGKHDLRGHPRPRAGTLDDLVGFKMFLRAPALAQRLAGVVEVVLFQGGYAGLQPVEGGRLNLCLLVSRDRLKSLGGSWEALWPALLTEPALAPLADAEPLLPRPITISGVPYGYLAAPSAQGHWLLGDQAAVIPSFCGDGMAMALHGGGLAADLWHQGTTAAAFQTRLLKDVGPPVRLARRVQRIGFTPLGRLAMMAGLGIAPGLLGWLARATRVADPGPPVLQPAA